MDIMEKNNIETLISLHKIDKKLFEIDGKRENFPKIINDLNNNIESLKNSNLETEVRKDEIDKRKVQINNNVSDFNSKIESLNNQMYKVKSNKEYEALLNEIDHLKIKLSEEKNEIKNFDAELEEIATALETNNNNLNSDNEKLIDTQKKLNNANSEIVTEEKTLINDKDNILKQLSDDDINLYDEKKNEYDLAFAMITRKSCSNCFSGLPPQLFINVVERNKLQVCPSCNIFLYIDDENIDL